MRILVVMAAFNEEDFIAKNIENLYPYVDKIAVSTTHHVSGSDSTDNTRKLVEDFIDKQDTEDKVCLRSITLLKGKRDFDTEEGQVKTDLMQSMEPRDGDWIWVVDADEFYAPRHMRMLRSRYILNHQMITKYGKQCILMQAMCFAYNISRFYWSRHGRMFLYKEGSYFSKVNHFTRKDGTKIYGDEFGWDMPPSYMYMYHMRYVRSSLERLIGRYQYRQDSAGQKKLGWFKHVFMVYPKNQMQAIKNNKSLFGVDGFDGALSGPLKDVRDYDMPDCLQELGIDLFNDIKWRMNDESRDPR